MTQARGSGHMFGADLGVVAEGPDPDLGVLGIDVHVADRGVHLRDADGAQLSGNGQAHLIGKLGIANGRQAHGRGELPDTAAGIVVLEITFKIHGDVQRNPGRPAHGEGLCPVQGFGQFFRRNADTMSAHGIEIGVRDIEIVRRLLEGLVDLAVSPVEVPACFQPIGLEAQTAGVQFRDLLDPTRGQNGAAQGERQQLSDLIFQGHALDRALDEIVPFTRHF